MGNDGRLRQPALASSYRRAARVLRPLRQAGGGVMNPFERFGMRHLSPSSLNLWTAAPGLWALRYLAGVKDDGNAAMWRGRANEKGLWALLLRPDKKSALDAALAAFEDDAAGLADEDTEDEHN